MEIWLNEVCDSFLLSEIVAVKSAKETESLRHHCLPSKLWKEHDISKRFLRLRSECRVLSTCKSDWGTRLQVNSQIYYSL